MNINQIKYLCHDETIEVTQHFLIRCQQRNISYAEIKEAIHQSSIIEEYPDDYPYPSYLILGTTADNRKLHIVTGIGDNKLWLITAYEPNPEQWDNDFKNRKD